MRFVLIHKNHPFSPLGLNSGAERATISLATHLAALGHEVTVAGQLLSGGQIYRGVSYIDLGKSFDVAAYIEGINETVDVLLSLTRADSLYLSLANPHIKLRAIWLHDPNPVDLQLNLSLLNECIDVMIYASEALRIAFEKELGFTLPYLIHHAGFDEKIFHPREGQVDPFRISFAGALVPQKGIDILIDAFALVHREVPQSHLWIYGAATMWGQHYLEFLDQAKIQELNPHIHFAGGVPQEVIAESFSRSICAVIPSLSTKRLDPFPLISPEAQGCGCVLVVSNSGGLPESVIDGETGYVWKGGDPKNLAEKIIHILKNAEEHLGRRSSIIARARQLYTWDFLAKSFVEKISQVQVRTVARKINPLEMEIKKPIKKVKRLLVVDWDLPQFDKVGSDFRTHYLLQELVRRGIEIVLVALNSLTDKKANERYIKIYETMGIKVVVLTEQSQDLEGKIRFEKKTDFDFILRSTSFDAAWLIFWYVGRGCLRDLRQIQPQCHVVVDSIDLEFLRLMREAQLTGLRDSWEEVLERKPLEKTVYQQCDCVVSITEDDDAILKSEIPSLKTVVVPNVHPVYKEPASFDQRKDLMFIGAYTHPPNVDAAKYLVREIFPFIQRRLPTVKLYLVGSRPSAEVEKLASSHVIITGYVEDLTPYWQGCRLNLAPLRYGAGMKGKVGQAMAEGLPTVGTSIAFEGMNLLSGEHMLLQDDPEAFANLVCEAYEDKKLWEKLAKGGYEIAKKRWSSASVTNLLLSALEGSAYSEYTISKEADKAIKELKVLDLLAEGYSWLKLKMKLASAIAFENFIQQYPQMEVGYAALADFYLENNQIEEAKKIMDQGLKIAPENRLLRGKKGETLLKEGRFKEAYTLLKDLYQDNPENAFILLPLAKAAAQTGHSQDALNYFKTCFELMGRKQGKQELDLLTSYGRLLLDLKMDQNALPIFEAAVKLSSKLKNEFEFSRLKKILNKLKTIDK